MIILNSIHAILSRSQYCAEELLQDVPLSKAISRSYRERITGGGIIGALRIKPTLRNETIWVLEVLGIVGRGPCVDTDSRLE